MFVGLLDDFDLSESELELQRALPLASKSKRTKDRSDKVNFNRECKASGVGLRTRSTQVHDITVFKNIHFA